MFTTVWSSMTMNVPTTVQIRTCHLYARPPSDGRANGRASAPELIGGLAAATLLGDLDLDCHVGTEQRLVTAHTHRDAHRHQLRDLGEVARGVARRQDGERGR